MPNPVEYSFATVDNRLYWLCDQAPDGLFVRSMDLDERRRFGLFDGFGGCLTQLFRLIGV